jgi:flagellar protein FliO/FliZ
MNALLKTPKAKLVAATGLLAVLALVAPVGSMNAAVIARLILGGAALAGLAWWASRRQALPKKFALAPRLQVAARTGLSPKCSVALVEADGQTYLIAFGDGFAEIKETSPRSLKEAA